MTKRKTHYSCFVKIDGRWHRVSRLCAPLGQARNVFQNAMYALTMRAYKTMLRPVEGFGTESDEFYKNVWDVILNKRLGF